MAKFRTLEIKVGLLVAGALVLFMIATLLLGGGKKIFTSTYQLRVRMDNVTGVAAGSVVQLSGLPVGNVTHLNFVPNSSQIEVIFMVDKIYKPRITQGSIAGTRTQGALGDKYIFITPGAESNPPLEDGALLDAEKTTDLLTTIAENGERIENLFEVFHQAKQLLVNLNADGKSAQLMPNLVKSSEELNRILSQLRLAVEGGENGTGSLKQSMTHLESVLKKIDKGSGTLGALINEPDIYEKLKAALGGTSQSTFLKNQVRETIRSEK